jgi:hypothetical protein
LTASSDKSSTDIGHSRVADRLSTASASSARALTRRTDNGGPRVPFFLNVKMLNEERTTWMGCPFNNSTATSALGIRWLAKRGRRLRMGSRSMRSKACARYAIQNAARVKKIVPKCYFPRLGAYGGPPSR